MSSATDNPNDVELIKALCDLLQAQLDLKAGKVIIYNQKFDIPTTNDMYVFVAFQRGKPFGASLTRENVPASGNTPAFLQEVQRLNVQETYTINLYSRDGSARQRNHEVVFALHSTQCQQMQERYQFRMGYIPSSMIDVSHVEGAARINRYSLTFALLRAYTRTRPIEYYDTFNIPPELIINP
jgi:hypothetical protein